MNEWQIRGTDEYWAGWHDGNEAAAKRVREHEVRPLQQLYSMVSRTLEATHAELTELRNRQRSPLYSAGELSVELMPNKAVAVKPTGMIFDVSEQFDQIVDGPRPALNVDCDDCWDGQIRYSDNATYEEWVICPKCGESE